MRSDSEIHADDLDKEADGAFNPGNRGDDATPERSQFQHDGKELMDIGIEPAGQQREAVVDKQQLDDVVPDDASTQEHSFDDLAVPEKSDFSKPSQDVCLSWENITIEATIQTAKRGCKKKTSDKPSKKVILNNVSGCVLPG